MKAPVLKVLASAGASSLRACGGGVGDSSDEPPSFDELLTQFRALDDQALMFTTYNRAGFPTMGSYRDEGVMHFGTGIPQITLYGERYMTVDLEGVNYNGRFRGPSGAYFHAGLIGVGDILYDDTPASINDARRVPLSQGEIALERVN